MRVLKYPIKMETTTTQMQLLIDSPNSTAPLKPSTQSQDQLLFNTQEFCLSQTSTDAASDHCGSLDHDASDHASWAPLIEEDLPIRKVKSALDEELQSLMEAEEELQSIWRP